MIKIENVHVDNIVRAVYSARNAMNSWDKSDSNFETDTLGDNDLALAKKLSKAGTDHSKFLRMINVTCDIVAPMYWWKEFDTYKVGTVRNSCSTMHKITEKKFTLDDFSHEHLLSFSDNYTMGLYCEAPIEVLGRIIATLNIYCDKYLEADNKLKRNDLTESERKHTTAQKKHFWWQMIQLLPSSYNQRGTVQMNYQVLKNIYKSRKGHKLDEWQTFREWCETLPYFVEICGE